MLFPDETDQCKLQTDKISQALSNCGTDLVSLLFPYCSTSFYPDLILCTPHHLCQFFSPVASWGHIPGHVALVEELSLENHESSIITGKYPLRSKYCNFHQMIKTFQLHPLFENKEILKQGGTNHYQYEFSYERHGLQI